MSKARRPEPPKTLKAHGKRLWRSIVGDVAEGWMLDARELHFLARACQIADQLAALEKAIERDGHMIAGSRGQKIVNPAVSEWRQLELAKLRLLGSIELGDADQNRRAATTASQRGTHAAMARWSREASHG